MVSAPEGGSPSTFSYINGRRSWFSSSDTSQGAHRLPLQLPKKFRKDAQEKGYVGPTCGLATSPEVDPEVTVGTL
jgi:hypothetical protein